MVSGVCGATCGFHAGQAATDNKYPFGVGSSRIRYVDTGKFPRHSGVDDTAGIAAPIAKQMFVNAAATIGETGAYIVETTLARFQKDFRVGDCASPKTDKVRFAGRDKVSCHFGILDPADRPDWNVNMWLHGCGQVRIASLRLIHRGDGKFW